MSTIESKIFEWKTWDKIDTGIFVFYNCTMIEDFGDIKKGDQIDQVVINYDDSNIEFAKFHDEKDQEFIKTYDIRIQIHCDE